jgi:transcriptional regulator GlxA family with amidase domain
VTAGRAGHVDDGDVVTSAGIAAGIDMALHLVAQFVGEVRRDLQLEPPG